MASRARSFAAWMRRWRWCAPGRTRRRWIPHAGRGRQRSRRDSRARIAATRDAHGRARGCRPVAGRGRSAGRAGRLRRGYRPAGGAAPPAPSAPAPSPAGERDGPCARSASASSTSELRAAPPQPHAGDDGRGRRSAPSWDAACGTSCPTSSARRSSRGVADVLGIRARPSTGIDVTAHERGGRRADARLRAGILPAARPTPRAAAQSGGRVRGLRRDHPPPLRAAAERERGAVPHAHQDERPRSCGPPIPTGADDGAADELVGLHRPVAPTNWRPGFGWLAADPPRRPRGRARASWVGRRRPLGALPHRSTTACAGRTASGGPWRCSAVPIVDDGEIREWVGTHTDITEARRIQDDLERRQGGG